MIDPWMSHNGYDDSACYRCSTGIGEHNCWRREVAGRTEPIPEPLRLHQPHQHTRMAHTDRFQYGSKSKTR